MSGYCPGGALAVASKALAVARKPLVVKAASAAAAGAVVAVPIFVDSPGWGSSGDSSTEPPTAKP